MGGWRAPALYGGAVFRAGLPAVETRFFEKKTDSYHIFHVENGFPCKWGDESGLKYRFAHQKGEARCGTLGIPLPRRTPVCL